MKQFMGIRMFSFFPCLRVHCLDRYHFGWQSSKIWRCCSHWAIPVWIKSLKLLFHLDISEIQNTTLQEKYQRTDLMEMPMLTWKNIAIKLDQRVFLVLVYRDTSFDYRLTIAFQICWISVIITSPKWSRKRLVTWNRSLHSIQLQHAIRRDSTTSLHRLTNLSYVALLLIDLAVRQKHIMSPLSPETKQTEGWPLRLLLELSLV